MKQKDKIRMMFELMLVNSDKKGNLNMHIGDFAKSVRVSDNVIRFFRNYYEGKGKQQKRILYTEVTEEMVDDVYNNYTQKNTEENDEFIKKMNSLNNTVKIDRILEQLENQRDLVIALNKDLNDIKHRVFWMSDIVEKIEEYLEL